LGELAASLAGLWIYGIKTDNSARERDRENWNWKHWPTLSSFLIYAPMQFIGGRPGGGNGKDNFWRHHAMNTSLLQIDFSAYENLAFSSSVRKPCKNRSIRSRVNSGSFSLNPAR
jgi:hypothetical protein